MSREKPEYKIEQTTYRYKKTDDVDEKGHNIYVPISEKTSVVKGVSNFSDLKKKLHNESVNNDNMRVNYKNQTYTEVKRFGKVTGIRKNPKELDYVHKNLGNGEYERTYYKAMKK